MQIDDDLGLVGNAPTLHMDSFLPKHAGNYTCKVTNSIGTDYSRSAEIKGIILTTVLSSYLIVIV